MCNYYFNLLFIILFSHNVPLVGQTWETIATYVVSFCSGAANARLPLYCFPRGYLGVCHFLGDPASPPTQKKIRRNNVTFLLVFLSQPKRGSLKKRHTHFAQKGRFARIISTIPYSPQPSTPKRCQLVPVGVDFVHPQLWL